MAWAFGWEDFWCPAVGPAELEALGVLVIQCLCDITG